MNAESPRKILYHVEFDFEDDDPNGTTSDFRDLLMEKFEQAVLENRMTNVVVCLNHERMINGEDMVHSNKEITITITGSSVEMLRGTMELARRRMAQGIDLDLELDVDAIRDKYRVFIDEIFEATS